MDYAFLLKSLLFMNFGQQLFVDYSTPHCMASNTGSMIGRCNRVFNNGPVTAQDIIDVKNYFKDIHFTWVVDACDTTTIAALENHGLVFKATAPALIRDLQDIPITRQHDIRVKEITEDQEFNQWIAITNANYSYDAQELAKAVRFLVGRAQGKLKLYLGYYHETPVAASMIVYHAHKLVSMHLIGTLKEFRSKGVGMAILSEPLGIAYNDGYRHAVLLTSTMGTPLAHKLGFKEYTTYVVYGNY